MILFTASGALASAYAELFPCKIVSARRLSDDILSELLTQTDVVVHNAAVINTENLSDLIDGNFLLTKRILDLAFRVNLKIRFINISSMSILKDTDSYLNPQEMSNYAFSKYIAEQYCLRQPLSKSVVNVRFSTLFYESPDRDGLSKLAFEAATKKEINLFNNGEAKRDFIPIYVAAQYLFKLTQKSFTKKTINIASGEPLSFKHFVDLIVKTDPSVKINNQEVKTVDVLSNFSKQDILELDKIDFDMDAVFIKYLKSLYANLNL